jgi:hypothetical protein
MTHIAKLIFYLLRELIFDSKDEYNYKSRKFNTRKFLILILFCLSVSVNAWIFYRYLLLATEHLNLKAVCEKVIPPRPGVKNPPNVSSDRALDSSK